METLLVTPQSEETRRQLELSQWNARINQYIGELNKLANEKDGQWVQSSEFGLAWVPSPADRMGAKPTPPSAPPEILKELVNFGKTLDINNIPEKSVVVVKIGTKDPQAAQALQMNIIRQILEPRREQLQAKKLTVMFMSAEDDISSIPEEDMNQAGWFKKEKSLIITPDKF